MEIEKTGLLLKNSAFKGSLMIPVIEPSQVGEARRRAVERAIDLGYDEVRRGEVAIAVTELATNLVKHTTKGGAIIVQECMEDQGPELEIISLDRGPGLVSIEKAMSDGFSTAGSMGTGLGAARRLARVFDMYSRVDQGTAIALRMSSHPKSTYERFPRIGGISLPKRGELVPGDTWAAAQNNGDLTLMVADGLGHGYEAAEASAAAASIMLKGASLQPHEILAKIHQNIRSTRGAAVSIAEIDSANSAVKFAGLGNISACIINGGDRQQMVSHDGTAGFEARRIKEYSYNFPANSLLVMHSDGCSTRWKIDAYPGLATHSATIISAVLLRDSAKHTDDATLVVVKNF